MANNISTDSVNVSQSLRFIWQKLQPSMDSRGRKTYVLRTTHLYVARTILAEKDLHVSIYSSIWLLHSYTWHIEFLRIWFWSTIVKFQKLRFAKREKILLHAILQKWTIDDRKNQRLLSISEKFASLSISWYFMSCLGCLPRMGTLLLIIVFCYPIYYYAWLFAFLFLQYLIFCENFVTRAKRITHG